MEGNGYDNMKKLLEAYMTINKNNNYLIDNEKNWLVNFDGTYNTISFFPWALRGKSILLKYKYQRSNINLASYFDLI